MPKTATEEAVKKLPPFLSAEKNEGRVRWRKRFDTPEKYQAYMTNYYRLVTEVDAGDRPHPRRAAEAGSLDNTLVVFTGDNGYFHGEHGLADKWYPYEEALRVPLIVRDPRLPKAKRGTTRDALVLNLDVAPTVIAAAGAKVPDGVQGRDVRAAVPGRDAAELADRVLLPAPGRTREGSHPAVGGRRGPDGEVRPLAGLRLRGAVRPGRRPARGTEPGERTRRRRG